MRRSIVLAAFAVVAASTSAAAQAKVPGARGDFLASFTELEGKFTMLAEAFPVDKYGWRPGKGVRSVCEVFVHISAENYEMGKAFGAVAAPKELANAAADKCLGDKATVIAAMKASFAAIKTAVTNTKDSDLEAPFTLFGAARPRRTWLLATAEHAGEHLGQQIAYARVNGIVPPWSK
jgi:uncharacterized damage-inducible protein DinB